MKIEISDLVGQRHRSRSDKGQGQIKTTQYVDVEFVISVGLSKY